MARITRAILPACLIAPLLLFSSCDFKSAKTPGGAGPETLSDPSNYTLPDTAYRVAWDLTAVPSAVQPGMPKFVTVRVTNISSSTWPSIATTKASPRGAYTVRLSHRWWDADRKNLVADYASRVDLARAVAPKETIALTVELRPPSQPGSYQLQLDLVHELMAWFESKGAAQAFVPVQVQP